MAMAGIKKRLCVCADGTWMDSDDGFQKPTLIPYVPTGTLQVPSNVTRIGRALKRRGLDGTPQIIFYHSGVGTSSSALDTFSGGLLGTGISENIREVYSFVAANYQPGDEMIFIGFSRGAFTVRSVAGMIENIGLLTREGMEKFYPIFKDQENFMTDGYRDIFPTIPFPDKPHGEGAARIYKRRLEKNGLTRVYDPDGNVHSLFKLSFIQERGSYIISRAQLIRLLKPYPSSYVLSVLTGSKIRVQAVAVWDTVGSLGIPNISWLSRLGLPHSTREYRFYNTNLSDNVRHAFQALALDEHRSPFQAAVWERNDMRKCNTDLRQVWFPGAHSNVGGGYDDQEIANISLTWMMDQLTSIGVAFQDEFVDNIYNENVRYYENPPKTRTNLSSLFSRPTEQWAITPIFEKYSPVRPWALGKIWNSEVGIWKVAGKGWRTPGMNMRANPQTGATTSDPMVHTNERIHSCVRVRLELEGLGMDDHGLYKCRVLRHNGWVLRRVRLHVEDPIPWNASWSHTTPPEIGPPGDERWVWEYEGPEETAPPERIMVEENLGPYQRKLLLMNRGRNKRHRKRRRRKSGRPEGEQFQVEEDSLTDDRSRGGREETTKKDAYRNYESSPRN